MSKIISKEIKIESLMLYRNILKLHYLKLNEEMRLFGDYFVKTEFIMNYKMANEKQLGMFLTQWKIYFDDLTKMKDIRELNLDTIEILNTKMDIDQKKSLDDIKNIIQNK